MTKLDQILTERKISNSEIATLIEKREQTVINYRTSKSTPTVDDAIKIASFLGLTVEEVFAEQTTEATEQITA